MESLLGLRLEGGKLHFAPCLPADWPGFKIHYRYRETVYHIEVLQSRAATAGTSEEMSVTVDGDERHEQAIALIDDRKEHSVEVRLHAN